MLPGEVRREGAPRRHILPPRGCTCFALPKPGRCDWLWEGANEFANWSPRMTRDYSRMRGRAPARPKSVRAFAADAPGHDGITVFLLERSTEASQRRNVLYCSVRLSLFLRGHRERCIDFSRRSKSCAPYAGKEMFCAVGSWRRL